MRKLLGFLVVLLVCGYAVFVLGAEENITLHWGDYTANIHPVILAFGLIILLFAFLFIWRFVLLFWHSPRKFKAFLMNFRMRKMHNATFSGLMALELDDTKSLEKALYVLENTTQENPETAKIAQIVKFKANQKLGISTPIEATSPQLEMLQLKANIAQAIAQKEWGTVLHLCEGYENAAYNWRSEVEILANSKLSQWQSAIEAVDFALKKSFISKPHAGEWKAAIQCAQALTLTDGNLTQNSLVKSALKLAPQFLPAVILQVHQHQAAKNVKAAAKLIETIWCITPHPHLGQAYVDLRAGDTVSDKLSRAHGLASRNPEHFESKILVATAALHAGRADEFLANLADYTETPSQRVCLLLHQYEMQRSNISAAAQEWLLRSLNSPLDMGWNFNGILAQKWSIFHPISGDFCIPTWHSGAFAGTVMNASAKNALANKQIGTHSDVPLISHLLA